MNLIAHSKVSVFLAALFLLSPAARAQHGPSSGYRQAMQTCAPVQTGVSISLGRGTPVSVQISHGYPVVQREVVHERVWVPGTVRRVWVPPVYETRYDACGRPYVVEIACGHWETICEPGHYELRRVSHGHGHRPGRHGRCD